MTERWIDMFHTIPHHPLLTRKGAAAPSPDRPATQGAARIPGPAPRPLATDERQGEGDLAGLIRRCGAAPGVDTVNADGATAPIRSEPGKEPDTGDAGTESPLSWMIARRATSAYEAPVRREEPSARPESTPTRSEAHERQASAPRRQLTVRLGMDRFLRFDRIARLTGRSYQDLQAEAVERLLEAYHN